MEACYLNHQHPEALIATLNATSAFVPVALQQQTFQSLLKTALFPLGQLQTSPNRLFARYVTQNLWTLLDSGQGLPLLFPSHEIDFHTTIQQKRRMVSTMIKTGIKILGLLYHVFIVVHFFLTLKFRQPFIL
jgi:hypothetical protein